MDSGNSIARRLPHGKTLRIRTCGLRKQWNPPSHERHRQLNTENHTEETATRRCTEGWMHYWTDGGFSQGSSRAIGSPSLAALAVTEKRLNVESVSESNCQPPRSPTLGGKNEELWGTPPDSRQRDFVPLHTLDRRCRQGEDCCDIRMPRGIPGWSRSRTRSGLTSTSLLP